MGSVGEVLKLLSDERRRYVCYYLSDVDRSGAIPVDELTEAVARMQFDDASKVPNESIENLKVNLQHVQLPKADEAAFVEYDREAGTVRLVERPAEFEALLAVTKDIELGEGPNVETS